jgi:hypothetical protein
VHHRGKGFALNQRRLIALKPVDEIGVAIEKSLEAAPVFIDVLAQLRQHAAAPRRS